MESLFLPVMELYSGEGKVEDVMKFGKEIGTALAFTQGTNYLVKKYKTKFTKSAEDIQSFVHEQKLEYLTNNAEALTIFSNIIAPGNLCKEAFVNVIKYTEELMFLRHQIQHDKIFPSNDDKKHAMYLLKLIFSHMSEIKNMASNMFVNRQNLYFYLLPRFEAVLDFVSRYANYIDMKCSTFSASSAKKHLASEVDRILVHENEYPLSLQERQRLKKNEFIAIDDGRQHFEMMLKLLD